MKRAKQASRAGVTLVETMVAVLIFALCIGGLCSLVVTTREMHDRARSHYVAVNICKNRLERARTVQMDELHTLAEMNVRINGDGSPYYKGRYRRTTSVSQARTNLIELVVQVDILNRITLEFDGENEIVHTYVADMVETEE